MTDIMKVGDTINASEKITSLELVHQINLFREKEGNRAVLQHSDLLKVIRDEFEEEIGLGIISDTPYKHPQNGQEYPMFELTLSQAKQVLVRESKFVRKAIIAYIEQLESKIKIPRTYSEALQLAADQAKELEEKQKLLEEQAPKVDYYNNIVDRGKSLSFRDTSKLLGYKETAFIFFLLENGYVYRDRKNKLMPIAEYVGKYFEVKEFVRGEHNGVQTLITQQGREHFYRLIENLKKKAFDKLAMRATLK